MDLEGCIIRSLLLVLLTTTLAHATTPTYSPENLTDASGNFAFSNATIIWAALPAGEAYQGESVSRISGGLTAFYSMVHGFITVVLPVGIPDEIVEKILDGKTSEIASSYSDYISFFIGYAICVTVGILFFLVVPIIAICFCCCRCCCKNCGGKLVQSEKDASKNRKKWLFIFVLLGAMVFLIVGSVCILLNNDATSTSINDIPKNTVSNLKDLEIYVNNTVLEATHLIQNNYNFLNTSLNRDLDNIDYLVGLPLRTDIETNTGIRTTISNGYSLVTSLDNADTALADVETKRSSLSSSLTTLETSLNTSKSNLDSIFAACTTCPAGQPDYATALVLSVNQNNFPDLTGPRSSMDSAKGTNMTAELVKAEKELDDVPQTVVNDSATTVQSIRDKIGNLSDDIDPIMNQIRDINNLFVGSNATIDLDKLSDDVTDFGETLEKYDKYRWYGGLSLGCIVLLYTALIGLGITCGILGSHTKIHPANRGCVSNCGGVLMVVSVALIFIFSPLLMLLTTTTFMVGAPIHRLACFPITDLDKLEDLAQIYNDHEVGAGKYFMGDLVLDNDTIALTLTGMLRDCKAGRSAYTSFRMEQKFDLTDLLNYSKTLDVQAEIDAVNVDLSSVNVYPAALKSQLTDLKNAVNINFTQFYIELQNTPTTGNLSVLADEIDTYATTLNGTNAVLYATTVNDLQTEATNIRNIETNEYANVQSDITALNTSVATMESTVSSIPSQVDTLDSGLNATDSYIQNSTATVITNLLNTYASRLLGIADSYTAKTETGIKTEMGNCRPVWNTYNSLLVYTFCYNFMDTFNGFWFSLGWCVFFSVIGLILSIKLSRFFRRMSDMDPPGRESITPSKLFENKVYPEVTCGEYWPQSDSNGENERDIIIENEQIEDSIYGSGTQVTSPVSFYRETKQEPAHIVELNSGRYVGKKSPLSFGQTDKSLVPVLYEGDDWTPKVNKVESDKKLTEYIAQRIKQASLHINYRNNKISNIDSECIETKGITKDETVSGGNTGYDKAELPQTGGDTVVDKDSNDVFDKNLISEPEPKTDNENVANKDCTCISDLSNKNLTSEPEPHTGNLIKVNPIEQEVSLSSQVNDSSSDLFLTNVRNKSEQESLAYENEKTREKPVMEEGIQDKNNGYDEKTLDVVVNSLNVSKENGDLNNTEYDTNVSGGTPDTVAQGMSQNHEIVEKIVRKEEDTVSW